MQHTVLCPFKEWIIHTISIMFTLWIKKTDEPGHAVVDGRPTKHVVRTRQTENHLRLFDMSAAGSCIPHGKVMMI